MKRVLLPGTPIFGVAFGDGSCGCWTASRDTTRAMADACVRMGLTVNGFLTVRMKRHKLVEELL